MDAGGRGAQPVKYIDEFQDPELARRLLDDIHATVTRPWALMEVCGGQTHRSSGTASTNCCRSRSS